MKTEIVNMKIHAINEFIFNADENVKFGLESEAKVCPKNSSVTDKKSFSRRKTSLFKCILIIEFSTRKEKQSFFCLIEKNDKSS